MWQAFHSIFGMTFTQQFLQCENGTENSDSDVDSWELPSNTHSDTPETTESGDTSGNSGPGAENAQADELPNTTETEASSGGST